MKYEPIKMLRKSRFVDLYNGTEAKVQSNVIEHIQKLLKENEEYTNSGNYGHLCNLFSALAFCILYFQEMV